MNSPGPILSLLGISHRKTPLSLRERMTLSTHQQESLSQWTRQEKIAQEVLVLNTCNRVEVYLAQSTSSPQAALLHWLSQQWQIPLPQLEEHSYHKSNQDTISHALRVCCGLDSQILGETEISGQVKAAFRLADAQKHLGKQLHFLFQKSFQASKWCRSKTQISEGLVSIGNITVDLANRIFGHIRHAKVLILGSGEVAESTATAMQTRGCTQLFVSSRTQSNANNLRDKLSCATLPWQQRGDYLHDFDIIVSSTSAPEPIILLEDITQSLKKRKNKPIFLIDLAMPRDIDDSISQLDDAYLYNLDDLSQITQATLKEREQAAQKCHQYIDERSPLLWQKMANS